MSESLENPFVRVAAVVPKVNPADVDFNVDRIIEALDKLEEEKVDVAVFPEMSVTGYTCGDLFFSSTLLGAARKGIERLCDETRKRKTAIVVGAPEESDGAIYNMAYLIQQGSVRMKVGKRNIPNYNEFYECRWFKPWQGEPSVYNLPYGKDKTVKVGIEICEDLWVPDPPSVKLCQNGAEIILNLSASDDIIGKYSYLLDLVRQQSAKLICGYVYAGAGFGESSTDLVFDGKEFIAENGKVLARNTRWANDGSMVIADIDPDALRHDRQQRNTFSPTSAKENVEVIAPTLPSHQRETSDIKRAIDPRPFVPANSADLNERCDEIVNIQAAGLARRLDFTGCRKLVVGISGGLDSTLAVLVACRAFDRLGLDRKGIIAVTMPGFGTTTRTRSNAVELCRELGATLEEISIVPSVVQHFSDIGHDKNVHDVTYENGQARMRTLILMDLANKHGGMVLGTGDLSELALGWATYNGDHMSMYNVNGGVPKTLVRHLVSWFAGNDYAGTPLQKILEDICATPVSPELLPPTDDNNISQVTEDLVGPYELHDFFLYYTLRFGFGPEKIFILAGKAFEEKYDDATLLKWLGTFYRRFFAQQFKRSCLPDGPKVGSVCLSPRGDWRMPSDASANLWLSRIERLKKYI